MLDLLLFKKGIDDSPQGKLRRLKRRRLLFITTASILLVVVSFLSLGVGAIMIGPDGIIQSVLHSLFPDSFSGPDPEYYEVIVVTYRAPRVIMGVFTGIALAVAGAVMQGIMRNPLVSPFTLGLSSAATCGAAITLVLGPIIIGSMFAETFMFFGTYVSYGFLMMALFAFLFGMLSIVFILMLTRGNVSQSTLVLTGTIIGYVFQAVLSYMKYVSDDATLHDIVKWTLGGMWGASWSSVVIAVPVVIITSLLIQRLSLDINTLSAGPDVAHNLGVNIPRLRMITLTLTAVSVSTCMAFTGTIGFIGLIAPHICRILLGGDYKYLVPASALMGALILVISDSVARVILAPEDIPVGIIMYILGGVFFLFLLRKMRMGYDV